MKTACLDCDELIELAPDLRVGERLVCAHCQIELEVINIDPIELDWIFSVYGTDTGAPSLYDETWWRPSTKADY